MKEDKQTVKKSSMFVKLPSYIGAFLLHQYGGKKQSKVVHLPSMAVSTDNRICDLEEMLYECMVVNLTENKNIEKSLSPLCLCQTQWEIYNNENIVKPVELDLSNYFEFELPSAIWMSGAWKIVDRHFQLTRPGTTAFRQVAKYLFWECLRKYVERSEGDKGMTPSLSERVARFCTRNNISAEDFDNLIRSYRREILRNNKTLANILD